MNIIFFILLTFNFNSDLAYNKGIKKYKKGSYKEAIKYFLEEKKKKRKFKNFFYLGHSYSLTGDNKNALKMYKYALTTKFKKSIIHFEMGLSYFLLDKSDEALENLNLAIEYDKNNPQYLINRATIKYDLGLINSACKDWKKAFEIDGNSIDKEIIIINCN